MTLKFGILGDSDTDSYRGDDDRGGDFGHVTFCVPEILVRLRSFDLGAWGSYGEPRRTDYAHNWSRSGATSHTMISAGQHTGLAAQVSSGDVDYCFIDIGTNNFHPGHSSPSLYDEVYDGTLSGGALQSEIDDCIGDMETAMDALLNAGAAGVVVALWHQWSDEVAAAYGYTNGTNRQRVTDTIDAINAGIISACNSRGIPYVGTWDDLLDWAGGVQGTAPNEYVEIGGRQITLTLGDEPTNFQLSDTHMGTVAQCVMVNEMVLRPLNEHYEAGLALLAESEMLSLAGLLFPTTPVLDDFNRADGGLGGDWGAIVPGVGVQPLAISSNEAAPSASGVCAEYWSGESFGADCEVYVTLAAAPGTGNGVAVGARVADPGSVSTYDGYDVVYTQSGGTDTIVVRRVTDVVPTTILTINLDLSAGDKLGMSLVGDLIRVYVDDGDGWVSVGEVLDSTYENQGGYLVISTTGGTAARLDDFGGGDVVEAVVVEASAALASSAVLAGVGQRIAQAESALSGAGSLDSGGRLIKQVQAAMTGDGAVAAAGQRIAQAMSALDGTGSLTAQGRRILQPASALAGQATLASAGQRIVQGATSLAGSAAATAAGSVGNFVEGLASLLGAGSVSAQGRRVLQADAALGGVGSVTAIGQKVLQAALSMAGQASLATVGTVGNFASAVATLVGEGSLSGSGQRVLGAATSLVGEGALSVTGRRILQAASSLLGAGALSATGSSLLRGASSLAGSATVTASGIVSGAITALVELSLHPRSFALSLRERGTDLSLRARNFVLSLRERS